MSKSKGGNNKIYLAHQLESINLLASNRLKLVLRVGVRNVRIEDYLNTCIRERLP